MQDPGELIALSVVCIYTLLGPPLLLAIYTLFDILSKPANLDPPSSKNQPNSTDPALWSAEEISSYMNQR